MNGIYLLLGSNVGNRLAYLREATNRISKATIQILDESSVYETAPWGLENQAWYLNVVLRVVTSKAPEELLSCLLDIESALGRTREEKWGARTIDIDMLYYLNYSVQSKTLTVPHPEIQNRKFALIPMVELAPLDIHPTLNKNQMELLAECTDPLDCKLTDHTI